MQLFPPGASSTSHGCAPGWYRFKRQLYPHNIYSWYSTVQYPEIQQPLGRHAILLLLTGRDCRVLLDNSIDINALRLRFTTLTYTCTVVRRCAITSSWLLIHSTRAENCWRRYSTLQYTTARSVSGRVDFHVFKIPCSVQREEQNFQQHHST